MLESNIIKIALRSSKVIKTLPVHKWDTGMKLEFEGIDIPLNTTCHFETGDGTTVNQLVDSTTKRVDIPNDLIGQSCWFEELRAHLYIPTSSYAMTVYDIIIPVIEREQPADHVSPDNTQTIEEWITEQVNLIDADRQAVENMSATASVDNNTGTPAVTVTKTTVSDHVNLDFAFANIKGAKGDTGDSVGTVTASVDANTGTPSVTVTQTGGSGSPIDIDLAFSNLKGATGATGAQGIAGMGVRYVTATIDEDGGSPECFVLENVPSLQPDPSKPIKDLQFGFVNIKGDKGDDGKDGTEFLPSDTASGNPATFTDGADDVPVDELVANIFIVQSGTPTPSNPIPLVGYTEANITHNGDTETFEFGQTVYGGNLNVTTGVLTIDTGYIADASTLTWAYQGSYHNIFSSSAIDDAKNVTSSSDRNKGIASDKYRPSTAVSINNSMDDNGMLISARNMRIRNDAYDDDIDGFRVAIKNTQLAYPLATPITVQLTPTEVKTVLGNNSISSDVGGNVEVIYRADIDKYVEKKVEEAKELPSVTSSDNGKLLGVSSGKWKKVYASTELPAATSADEGKFLTVNSSGQWAKSNAFEEEVFTFTLADNTTVTKTFLVKV